MRLIGCLSLYRIVLILALLLLTVRAWAGDLELDRATLKGIDSIRVVVEKVNSDAEKDGLTRTQVQTDVELRLRQSGIKVVSSSVFMLYVQINTYRPTNIPIYAFNVALELWQPVTLIRDATTAHLATTWSVPVIGVAGTDRLREVRSYVIDGVDKFINAYLEQNPKR